MRLCGISSRFQLLSPCTGQVTHALLTRPPLSHISRRICASFDLHVLGTPPAFILSQDQTLKINVSRCLIQVKPLAFPVLLFVLVLKLSFSFHGPFLPTSLASGSEWNSRDFSLLNWTFKVVLLFSYQVSLYFLSESFYSLTQLHIFVKNFFIFFNFFQKSPFAVQLWYNITNKSRRQAKK